VSFPVDVSHARDVRGKGVHAPHPWKLYAGMDLLLACQYRLPPAAVLNIQGQTVCTFRSASSMGGSPTTLPLLPCHCRVCKLGGKAGSRSVMPLRCVRAVKTSSGAWQSNAEPLHKKRIPCQMRL
jgi:hypothetical protein